MRRARPVTVLLVALGALALLVWWRTRARPAETPSGEAPHALEPTLASELARPGGGVQEGRVALEPETRPSSGPEEASGPVLVFTGRVLECDAGAPIERGRPAAGVEVRLARGWVAPPSGPTPESSARTDASGAFRFVVPDPLERPLWYGLSTAPDASHATVSTSGMLQAGASRTVEVRLVRRGPAPITGTTRDVRGAPLADVEVEAVMRGDALASELRVRALSDLEGAFRLVPGPTPTLLGLDARKPGYVFIEGDLPERERDGSWRPVDLTLSASAVLRVHVTDALGAPLAGARVGLAVAAGERFADRSGFFSSSARAPLQDSTDASGVALFPAAWAGVRLALTLTPDPDDPDAFVHLGLERVLGGRLLLSDPDDEEQPGAPLVLAAGRELDVHFALPPRVRLVGEVVDEAHRPIPEPALVLESVGRVPSDPRSRLAEARGDAAGRFSMEALAPPSGRLRLQALEDSNPWFPPPPMRRATLELDARAIPESITLVAEPMLAIAGRIVADPPVASVVYLWPSGTGGGPGAGADFVQELAQPGEFRFAGLAPGRYDLEVEPRDSRARVVLQDVEAGREDLVVALAEPRQVRVRIEVVGLDPARDEVLLLRGSRLRGAPLEAAPELPREATFREPSGWPAHAGGPWSGARRHWTSEAVESFGIERLRASPTTVLVDEGLGWIGVRGTAADGNPAAPMGTGLVRFVAGEVHLRFELSGTGVLVGRNTLPVHARGGYAALARGGTLLHLEGERARDLEPIPAVFALDGDGSFRFPAAPAGPLELRLGTREELLSGRWLRRETLTLARGARVELEIGD